MNTYDSCPATLTSNAIDSIGQRPIAGDVNNSGRIKTKELFTTPVALTTPIGLAELDDVWALTGTPLENRVGDLVAVYRFVRPGLLSLAMSRSEMHSRMQPFFLRRLKHDVLHQLPPIQVQEVPLELEGRQRQAYELIWESRSSVYQTSS